MGISLSKRENPLVQEGFDGESGDYLVAADNYHPAIRPEWIFGNIELGEVKDQLRELDALPTDVPMFTLEDHITAAKCVKVYDGDTVHLVMKFNGEMVRYRFRMIGYNSPEMRGVSDEEKQRAIAARDYLADRLLNKKVIARLGHVDKYGRPLCDLYIVEDEANITLENAFKVHINKEMIEKGHGIPYMG